MISPHARVRSQTGSSFACCNFESEECCFEHTQCVEMRTKRPFIHQRLPQICFTVIARSSTLELLLLKQRLSNIVIVGGVTQVLVLLCQRSLEHICSCQTNVSAILNCVEVATYRKLDYPALVVSLRKFCLRYYLGTSCRILRSGRSSVWRILPRNDMHLLCLCFLRTSISVTCLSLKLVC